MSPTVIRFGKTPQGFIQVVSTGMVGDVHVQYYRTETYDGKPYLPHMCSLKHDEAFGDERDAVELFEQMMIAHR